MSLIAGDYKNKDVAPKTTNLGDRLVKNMRICGSGIYTYDIREAELLHLTPIPEKYKSLEFINVYRPPEVLVQNKDKFARVPIITGHHQLVHQDNAKQLVVGMVGDTVESEKDEHDGETYLYTTGTIVAGDGVDAYEQYGQLSVGYDPVMGWCEEPGTHNGVPYQAVLQGFNDVNHLLICKVARGGPQCMVMDSLDDKTPLQRFITQRHGGVYMGVFKKIFNQKKIAGDAALVVSLLESISLGADPKATVDKIKGIAGDALKPEMREYLDELSQAKGESEEDIKKAVDIVINKYVGDSKEEPPAKNESPKECGDEEQKEDKKEEVKKEEPPKEEPKSAGDAIDYEKLATMVAEKLKPAEKEEKTAGDEKIDENISAEALKSLSVAITGDSAKESFTSDDVMKSLRGE